MMILLVLKQGRMKIPEVARNRQQQREGKEEEVKVPRRLGRNGKGKDN